jgi:hypothetical protein
MRQQWLQTLCMSRHVDRPRLSHNRRASATVRCRRCEQLESPEEPDGFQIVCHFSPLRKTGLPQNALRSTHAGGRPRRRATDQEGKGQEGRRRSGGSSSRLRLGRHKIHCTDVPGRDHDPSLRYPTKRARSSMTLLWEGTGAGRVGTPARDRPASDHCVFSFLDGGGHGRREGLASARPGFGRGVVVWRCESPAPPRTGSVVVPMRYPRGTRPRVREIPHVFQPGFRRRALV